LVDVVAELRAADLYWLVGEYRATQTQLHVAIEQVERDPAEVADAFRAWLAADGAWVVRSRKTRRLADRIVLWLSQPPLIPLTDLTTGGGVQ